MTCRPLPIASPLPNLRTLAQEACLAVLLSEPLPLTWRQGLQAARLRERLADVSCVAPRGWGHRRRHFLSDVNRSDVRMVFLIVMRRVGLALAPTTTVGRAPVAAALASTSPRRKSFGSGRTRRLLLSSPRCGGRSCIRPPSCTCSAGLLGLSGYQRSRIKEKLCHSFSLVRTVVLVNTSSTSPSSPKHAMFMPCGTLLVHPTKDRLHCHWVETTTAHCWVFQLDHECQATSDYHGGLLGVPA